MTARNDVPMQFGSGQLTYEPDTMNLITFSFNRQFGKPGGLMEGFSENQDANGNTLLRYDQKSTQRQNWGSTDFGVDYQRSFRKKKSCLRFRIALAIRLTAVITMLRIPFLRDLQCNR